jgi:hypothetical protein
MAYYRNSELNRLRLLVGMSLMAHSQVASWSCQHRHSAHACRVPNYWFLLAAAPANIKSRAFRLNYPIWKRNNIFADHEQTLTMCRNIQGNTEDVASFCYETEIEMKLCTLSDTFCESNCSYSFLIRSSSALREEFSDLKDSAR